MGWLPGATGGTFRQAAVGLMLGGSDNKINYGFTKETSESQNQ
jgi:hypothetical protein